jgi:hypothetical protein
MNTHLDSYSEPTRNKFPLVVMGPPPYSWLSVRYSSLPRDAELAYRTIWASIAHYCYAMWKTDSVNTSDKGNRTEQSARFITACNVREEKKKKTKIK